MNLCTNAAQSMEEKGGILEVSVEDTMIDKIDMVPGDYIQIKVSDTGIGVAAGNINSIFEPYYTTKALGDWTGMGLAVVHGIVDNYGGKITVRQYDGQGNLLYCLPTHFQKTK